MHSSFVNCALDDVEFINCFFEKRPFSDCRFNDNTKIDEPRSKLVQSDSIKLEARDQAEIFRGIKEAYAGGGVLKQSRNYFFKQMQSVTRHNTPNKVEKAFGYLLEVIAGYGIRPWRVLCTMLLGFLVSFFLFACQLGLSDALIVTAGAFFTFGAGSEYLKGMGNLYRVIYILTSFFGISLTALLITVFANLWLRER